MRVAEYIRRHHIGLIALFVAMTGTAYAGTQMVGHPTNHQTLKAKKKKVVRGPAGPAGPQGPKGDTGSPGSPAASVVTGFVPDTGGGFGAPSGVSTTGSESSVQTLTPAGASITARDLSVRLSDSDEGDVTTTLRVNGADTALSCVVPHGDSDSACQDSSHAVIIPPNSRISLRFGNGSGTCCPSASFGWRALP